MVLNSGPSWDSIGSPVSEGTLLAGSLLLRGKGEPVELTVLVVTRSQDDGVRQVVVGAGPHCQAVDTELSSEVPADRLPSHRLPVCGHLEYLVSVLYSGVGGAPTARHQDMARRDHRY